MYIVMHIIHSKLIRCPWTFALEVPAAALQVVPNPPNVAGAGAPQLNQVMMECQQLARKQPLRGDNANTIQEKTSTVANQNNGTPLLYMWTCHDLFASPRANETCEPRQRLRVYDGGVPGWLQVTHDLQHMQCYPAGKV